MALRYGNGFGSALDTTNRNSASTGRRPEEEADRAGVIQLACSPSNLRKYLSRIRIKRHIVLHKLRLMTRRRPQQIPRIYDELEPGDRYDAWRRPAGWRQWATSRPGRSRDLVYRLTAL